jgi:small subunit ribosomal protein S9
LAKLKTKKKMYTGRRKTATTRIMLKEGSGQITVNGKDLKNYFNIKKHQDAVIEPLIVTDSVKKYDIEINAKGGGQTGQADAIKLGIARALVGENEILRDVLKKKGLLVRDPREKERKKYGQKKARKRFQFSKR